MKGGLVPTDLTITHNTFSNGWSYDQHPDGIVIQGPNCCGNTDRVVIKDNTITNFTQGIYVDCFTGSCSNIDIENNVVHEEDAYSYGGNSTAMNGIVIHSENIGPITTRIYNNTVDVKQVPFYVSQPVAGNNIEFKNNLLISQDMSILELAGTLTMDYNYYASAACAGSLIRYNGTNGAGGTIYSFASFVANTPHEDHGLCTTSAVLSMPTNYIPDADANSIGRGVDLSAVFTTDRAGALRVVPWDIGAYEFSEAPSPPTKFFRRRFQP